MHDWMRRLAIALVAASLAPAAPAADLPEVKQRGALRVLAVIIDEEPEFFALKPGVPPGFDHEVLEGFAKLHRLRLEVVPQPGYDALIPALLKGRGDLIAGAFTASDARRKQIAFTEEVFPTRNVVYTRKPHRVIQTLDQLRQEKVGTYKGTTMAEDIAAAGVPTSNVDDSIALGEFPEALEQGRITAAVDGIEAALKARQADPDLQLGMFLGAPQSLAYGVRQGDAQLLAALDDYISNMRRTPTWSRLVVKYFGEAAPEILKKARESR
jgi:ABC-type amino acid transport substrate-binding protein